MALFRGLFDFFQNDNKLDEKTGMTGKQKKLIQNTWAILRKDEISSGIAIMLALFKQYPEYQNQFKTFKDIPLDDLPKNKRFQAHCANIISAFSSAIDQLHDPELMEATLLSLADRHKARGQMLEHFQNLKQVLTNLLPVVFGKQYTPEVQEAWKKMTGWYAKHLKTRGMNDTKTSVSDILSGRRPICLSLHIAGGIVIAIIILTCCCTLCVRKKCARFFSKLTGKRKKEKHFDIEEGRKKRGTAKKLRKKRKRTVSPVYAKEETETAPLKTEAAPIIAREQERLENASPWYKCCPKKKRRRRLKR